MQGLNIHSFQFGIFMNLCKVMLLEIKTPLKAYCGDVVNVQPDRDLNLDPRTILQLYQLGYPAAYTLSPVTTSFLMFMYTYFLDVPITWY